MLLFPHENEILSSDDGSLVLTDQRIYMSNKEWGRSYTNSVFLEDISSIESNYKSHLIFILLGLITVAYSLYIEYNEWALFGFVFFLMWLFMREHTIAITPNGGKALFLRANKMSQDRVEELIYKISFAKSLRIAEISKDESLNVVENQTA